jgi:hypothetical protein
MLNFVTINFFLGICHSFSCSDMWKIIYTIKRKANKIGRQVEIRSTKACLVDLASQKEIGKKMQCNNSLCIIRLKVNN